MSEIVDCYLAGNSIRKVSEITGVPRGAVTKILDEAGIQIRYRRGTVEWIDDNHIKCSVCCEIKHKDDVPFSTSNSRDGYYFSYCKECRKQRQREDRIRRAPWKERAAKIARRAKEKGIDFDLDGDFLESLWKEQSGLCFYTDYEMISAVGNGISGLSVSVDKVVPELGYIKNNVVLCTQRANTIKNNMTLDELKMWMPTWYSRIQTRLEVI